MDFFDLWKLGPPLDAVAKLMLWRNFSAMLRRKADSNDSSFHNEMCYGVNFASDYAVTLVMTILALITIHEIASRNQLSESDIQQVARFNNGIRYDIQAILYLQTTRTLDEAVRIALKAEQAIKKQGIGSSMYKNKTDTNQSNSSQLGGDSQVDHTKSTHELDGEKRKTTTTTTSTHAVNKLSNNPYAHPVGVKCDKAHSESEDEGLIISYDAIFEDDDDHSEAFLGLVRRLVLTNTKKSEDSQRHNIFQTWCKINQDVFNVIIDGGSSENVISRDLVTRRKL
ncbi:hypothetical protein Tco_1165683 [Tanacetum coccineum]